MQAIVATRFGGPDVLTPAEVPTPTPQPGQILIQVESAAVNFADVIRRRGSTYPFPTTLPYTPGSEVAGTVAALGEGLDGPPVGTPVLALVGANGSGGYAQFAVAAAPQAVPIPPGVTADQAAGVTVAGATAVLVLTEVARLRAGETVLVQGAGGGVGQFAVQIARIIGATVIAAAATTARREAARTAGAQHTVDYTEPGWADTVRDLTDGARADVILEIGGADTFGPSLAALAPFGRLVVAGAAGDRPLVLDGPATSRFFYDPALNQSLHAFNLGLHFALRREAAVSALSTLIEHVVTGRVTVPVGTVLPLDQAAEAHRMLETHTGTGKIILRP